MEKTRKREPSKMTNTLEDVHKALKELMYIEDNRLIELLLAVKLSRLQKHSKLWLILTAPTGFGKSEMTKALEDSEKTTISIRTLTPSTILSGRKDTKGDLAPKLRDKLLLVMDLAQILKLPSETKGQLFSQLVDLYDGIASKNACGVNKQFKDLNVSFIGCSTPVIEGQFMIFQYLGTRFFLYSMDIKDRIALNRKIFEHNINPGLKEKRREAYHKAVDSFLREHKYKEREIKEETQEKLFLWANALTRLRVSVDTNMHNGEIANLPYDELPTRITEQFSVLYTSLKSLDRSYPDENAYEIIYNIVLSSIPRLRKEVLLESIRRYYEESEEPFTRKQMERKLKIGRVQINRELNILEHIGLLKSTEIYFDGDEEKSYKKWVIDPENDTIELLSRHKGYVTEVEDV